MNGVLILYHTIESFEPHRTIDSDWLIPEGLPEYAEDFIKVKAESLLMEYSHVFAMQGLVYNRLVDVMKTTKLPNPGMVHYVPVGFRQDPQLFKFIKLGVTET